MTVPVLALGAAWAAAGFAFGIAYFAALRRSVDLYTGGRGRVLPALLTAGRIAAAIALFGVAAQAGVGALLPAFLGFLVARVLAVRTARGVA